MANLIGKITSENGSFFIKHPDGTLTTAKVGEEVYEGDMIIGSASNTDTNAINIALSNSSSNIQVIGTNSQLFSSVVLNGETPEGTVIQNSDVSESLLEESLNATADVPNIADEQATLTAEQIENLDAAAAGEETTTDAGIVVARLENRTAAETDVTTDLRDATISTTTVDETITSNTIIPLEEPIIEEPIIEEPILIDAVLTLNDITAQEGIGTATILGSLDYTPLSTLVVTLSNGSTLTFGTDYVPGTFIESTPFEIQGDDAYIDSEIYTVIGTSYVGGDFNSIVSNQASINISDTIDNTTVTLNDITVDEEAGTATIFATIDNAPTAEPLVLNLSNGATITFGIGDTTATSTSFDVQADDAYKNTDISTISATVASGGNEFENLIVTDTATVTVTDEIVPDNTTVTLNDITVDEEAGTATIFATIDNAPTAEPLVLNLSNGATITFGIGNTTATSTSFSVQADDAYKNTDISTISATVASGGNEFENLVVTNTATVTVTDETIPDTTVLSVNEALNDDGTYTYTAIVTNTPDIDNDLVITLNTGDTIVLTSSVTISSITLDTQANSVTSVTGGNYEDLDAIYGFGQDIIMTINSNNSINNIDLNSSYFDTDNSSIELAISNITLHPRVDTDGYAININGDRLTSTDNIGSQNEETYYIKYNNVDSNNITAYRVESDGTAHTEEVVFTITSSSANENYSISLGNYPLDGAAYTLENIFESSATAYKGGNELSLLFNLDDLYVLATATDKEGNAGAGNEAYHVNYSTHNGLGIDDANSISTDEILYLNFTKSSMGDNLLLGDKGQDTDYDNNTLTDSVDNRVFAQNNEQYLTNAVFTLQKWGTDDQALWKAYNGDVLIAQDSKVYAPNDSTLTVISNVSDLNITNDVNWDIYNNVFTNNTDSTQTADISYSVDDGISLLTTSVTLDAGESFDFNAFNEVQFTAGAGDYSLSSMSAFDSEIIAAENQIINIDVETSNGIDSATGIMQVTFDGDDVIIGTDEDEVIDYTGTTSIDGGEGIDTLVLSGDEEIDFAQVDDNGIQNIENIDLTSKGSQSVSNITLSDVMDMVPNPSGLSGTNISETDHILTITGDSSDNVSIDSVVGSEEWISNSTEIIDSITYDLYVNDTDPTYKILIQTDINDTIS